MRPLAMVAGGAQQRGRCLAATAPRAQHQRPHGAEGAVGGLRLCHGCRSCRSGRSRVRHVSEHTAHARLPGPHAVAAQGSSHGAWITQAPSASHTAAVVPEAVVGEVGHGAVTWSPPHQGPGVSGQLWGGLGEDDGRAAVAGGAAHACGQTASPTRAGPARGAVGGGEGTPLQPCCRGRVRLGSSPSAAVRAGAECCTGCG